MIFSIFVKDLCYFRVNRSSKFSTVKLVKKRRWIFQEFVCLGPLDLNTMHYTAMQTDAVHYMYIRILSYSILLTCTCMHTVQCRHFIWEESYDQ